MQLLFRLDPNIVLIPCKYPTGIQFAATSAEWSRQKNAHHIKHRAPSTEHKTLLLLRTSVRQLESCRAKCVKLKALNYAKLTHSPTTRSRPKRKLLFYGTKAKRPGGGRGQSKLKAKSTHRSGVQTANGGQNHSSECVTTTNKKKNRES